MNNKGCMSASTIFIALGVILVGLFFWGKSGYNTFVEKDQEVNSKWSNVETVYQKRANLIPNLERTVKSYAQFEKETLTGVIEARSKATSVTIDPTNMTEADLARFQSAQGELSGALSRLMAVVEQYPNLKADQQYINFQREYIAIENSIRAETVYFNDAVKDYNNTIKKFPNNILANFTNFRDKPYFRSEVGAEKAPEVFK
ncbi:LemA family protein [Riemerella anatipestifer]|uniref:LemA family protein n=3 Tax=Riemerella anatipestifer TaxID=34085 RepID=A0AAP6HGZ5_RIEAN|nr:LemA family protein [Riemerella anatipestifer]ADQ81896.1 LemA family protein [Riemerella anatipestifer ATCC 11845 = DSM 15868]ADZ12602.1 LemA [Riemerella anatipestifer RA-GD]AFD55902.1 lema family protein [Riemerella anatipestifer ATCC 11845 = DSM 15868]AKQ39489.1 LemA family protein [Riemerella anatipestifer Yb2]EFT36102.1 LemA protein [Riemerella anatipestifer RA-YM]